MSRSAWDGIVSRVLDQTGVSATAFYAPGKGARGVAEARRLAVYLARCELNIPRRQVARYMGKSVQTIRLACHHTETAREDRGFDRFLDALAEGLHTEIHLPQLAAASAVGALGSALAA